MSTQETTATADPAPGFRVSPVIWAALAVAAVAGWFAFAEGTRQMLDVWQGSEEYSHAYLIPLISLFIAWQQKNELARLRFAGSWLGVAIVGLGILLGFMGQLGTVFTLQQLGLVTAIVGTVIALTGARALRVLWMPLLLLFFMIPLPNFLNVKLSASMQLISSELGASSRSASISTRLSSMSALRYSSSFMMSEQSTSHPACSTSLRSLSILALFSASFNSISYSRGSSSEALTVLVLFMVFLSRSPTLLSAIGTANFLIIILASHLIV